MKRGNKSCASARAAVPLTGFALMIVLCNCPFNGMVLQQTGQVSKIKLERVSSLPRIELDR